MSSVGSPTTASPKDLSPRATSPILATTPGRECSTRTGVAARVNKDESSKRMLPDRVVTNLTTSDSGLNATSAAMVLTLLTLIQNQNFKILIILNQKMLKEKMLKEKMLKEKIQK